MTVDELELVAIRIADQQESAAAERFRWRNMPCEDCGKLIDCRRTRNEHPVCHPCRRARKLLKPPLELTEEQRERDRARQRERYARGYRKPSESRPCSRCGKLLYWSLKRGSVEQPVCQPCRREVGPPRGQAPCTGCGKLMPTDSSSAPADQRMCWECRRRKREPRPCKACGKIFTPQRNGGKRAAETNACCRTPCGTAVRMGLTLAEYEANVLDCDRTVANGWANAVSIERQKCPECGREFWAHRSNMRSCRDDECRRKYASRISSEGIMRRYHADPAFRAKLITIAENRRAVRLGLEGITTQKNLVAFLYERDRAVCGVCGGEVVELVGPMRPSIDHIVPLIRGGVHAAHNVQLAHYRCNLSKQDKLPEPEILEVVLVAHKMLTGQELEIRLHIHLLPVS